MASQRETGGGRLRQNRGGVTSERCPRRNRHADGNRDIAAILRSRPRPLCIPLAEYRRRRTLVPVTSCPTDHVSDQDAIHGPNRPGPARPGTTSSPLVRTRHRRRVGLLERTFWLYQAVRTSHPAASYKPGSSQRRAPPEALQLFLVHRPQQQRCTGPVLEEGQIDLVARVASSQARAAELRARRREIILQ